MDRQQWETWLQVWAICWSGILCFLGFGDVGPGVLWRIVAPIVFFWLQPILAAHGTRWAGIALVINGGVLAGILVALAIVAPGSGITWSAVAWGLLLLAVPPFWAGVETLRREA